MNTTPGPTGSGTNSVLLGVDNVTNLELVPKVLVNALY